MNSIMEKDQLEEMAEKLAKGPREKRLLPMLSTN